MQVPSPRPQHSSSPGLAALCQVSRRGAEPRWQSAPLTFCNVMPWAPAGDRLLPTPHFQNVPLAFQSRSRPVHGSLCIPTCLSPVQGTPDHCPLQMCQLWTMHLSEAVPSDLTCVAPGAANLQAFLWKAEAWTRHPVHPSTSQPTPGSFLLWGEWESGCYDLACASFRVDVSSPHLGVTCWFIRPPHLTLCGALSTAAAPFCIPASHVPGFRFCQVLPALYRSHAGGWEASANLCS